MGSQRKMRPAPRHAWITTRENATAVPLSLVMGEHISGASKNLKIGKRCASVRVRMRAPAPMETHRQINEPKPGHIYLSPHEQSREKNPQQERRQRLRPNLRRISDAILHDEARPSCSSTVHGGGKRRWGIASPASARAERGGRSGPFSRRSRSDRSRGVRRDAGGRARSRLHRDRGLTSQARAAHPGSNGWLWHGWESALAQLKRQTLG